MTRRAGNSATSRRLSGTLVDGAVLVTPAVDLEGLPGTPVVAVDPHTGRSPLPTVDSDNLHGAQLATEHLLALGHRRIALLTGRADLKSAQQRETGYRGALAGAGVAVDETPDPARRLRRGGGRRVRA